MSGPTIIRRNIAKEFNLTKRGLFLRLVAMAAGWRPLGGRMGWRVFGGAERDRTAGLLVANSASGL
jgi:hypothetical protein